MANYIPYLLLTSVSIVILVGVLIWKKDLSYVTYYFFIAGLAYVFEYVILILLDSYTYRPNLVKIEIYDNIIGDLSSQAFSVPAAALLATACRLRARGVLVLVVFFIGVEELFQYLLIYQHNWWRTYYTAIFLIATFFLVQWLYPLILTYKFIRYVALYFSLLFFLSNGIFLLFLSFPEFHFHIGWFENKYRDSIAFSTMLLFGKSFMLLLSLFYRKFTIWGVLLLFVLVDYYLVKSHNLYVPIASIHALLFIIMTLSYIFLLTADYIWIKKGEEM